MSFKKWHVSACDTELASQIAQEHGISPFAALIAVSRGICSDNDIKAFFDVENTEMSDPFGYVDMDKAAQRINKAIDSFEKIAVFGDYDADGVTATALLCSYLDMREANFFYSLPTRDEGYGLTDEVIDRLCSQGASLIITVDNGINSVDEAKYAASLGIDMVITDHHRCGEEIPDAIAVVNPHRPDCNGGYHDFAGVGVAFKLVCALEGGDCEAMLDEFADLAAIGTIGDIVPLTGENRILVRRGIDMINSNPRIGILAMKNAAGASDKVMNSINIAFTIAPRLNAAGRMGSAERALDILVCDDDERAEQLAVEIEEANISRQKTEQELFALADEQLKCHPERLFDRIIVCDGENWHHGVIGIVASKMVEKYGKPCIIITRDGETAKGSGRSLEDFSLYAALDAVSDCLIKFGGHVLAAGLSIKSSRIDEFRQAINEYAKNFKMPFPVQRIDFKLNPKFVNVEILEALSQLEPFGASNPQPVFGLFKMNIDSISSLSGGKHVKLNLSKNGTKISALRFGLSPAKLPFRVGSTVDVAVTLSPNEYMGETRVGIYIKNIRYSGIDYDKYFESTRAYYDFRRGEKPYLESNISLVPDRKFIGNIYTTIKSAGGTINGINELFVDCGYTGFEICPVKLSVDALCELGLAQIGENGEIALTDSPQKANLDDSGILKLAAGLI